MSNEGAGRSSPQDNADPQVPHDIAEDTGSDQGEEDRDHPTSEDDVDDVDDVDEEIEVDEVGEVSRIQEGDIQDGESEEDGENDEVEGVDELEASGMQESEDETEDKNGGDVGMDEEFEAEEAEAEAEEGDEEEEEAESGDQEDIGDDSGIQESAEMETDEQFDDTFDQSMADSGSEAGQEGEVDVEVEEDEDEVEGFEDKLGQVDDTDENQSETEQPLDKNDNDSDYARLASDTPPAPLYTDTTVKHEMDDKHKDATTSPQSYEPENAPLNLAEGNRLIREAFYEEEDELLEEGEVSVDPDDGLEVLVPIKLNIPLGNNKYLQDAFTWSLTDKRISPEQYAELLCIDLDLQASHEKAIAESIHKQLVEFRKVCHATQGEKLIVIKLDITIGSLVFKDQFEWDLCASNSPEIFACNLCQDLGLSREFQVAISHSIQEQIAYWTQYNLYTQYGRASFPVTPQGCIREERDIIQWTPSITNVRIQPPPQQFYSAPTPGVAPVRQSSRLMAANMSSPYGARTPFKE